MVGVGAGPTCWACGQVFAPMRDTTLR
jgi:hypothetical protein